MLKKQKIYGETRDAAREPRTQPPFINPASGALRRRQPEVQTPGHRAPERAIQFAYLLIVTQHTVLK